MQTIRLSLAAALVLRFTALGIVRHSRPLLMASGAWGLYAAWEWLVRIRGPEVNIRVNLVNLLAMWPVLPILPAWALFRAFP